MLRLTGYARHRLGTPYVCPSCRHFARNDCRPRPAVHQRFSTTSVSRKSASKSLEPGSLVAASNIPSRKDSNDKPDKSSKVGKAEEKQAQNHKLDKSSKAESSKAGKAEEKQAQNHKPKKSSKAVKGEKKAAEKIAKRFAKAAGLGSAKTQASEVAENQDEVLEGAITALKKVLAARKQDPTTKVLWSRATSLLKAEHRPGKSKKASQPPKKDASTRPHAGESQVHGELNGSRSLDQGVLASVLENADANAFALESDLVDRPAPLKGPKKGKQASGRQPGRLRTGERLEIVDRPQPPVPTLSYGLDRVLFNSGVYQLQDVYTRVYNFDPYLSKIMPIQQFDFDALKQYITSSKDDTLISVARENGKRYTGSTSSMTSMLSHFHFLLSAWRPVNTSMLSQGFNSPLKKFTLISRAPAATFLHYKDGVYAIDADKQFDTANILSMLGKSMEKLLTLPRDDFERYRRENSHAISAEERDAAEAYHYTGYRDFMMRSQLDAYDPRLSGTGMFDLKTRAVVSIRMDARGYQKGLGYQLLSRLGAWESFEREYYDMIRSAFLKYSLQVRMGRMEGIYVAFHNTQQIFGFQYIPLAEMDLALHGTPNLLTGNLEFRYSLGLLNEVLNRITTELPKQSLRVHFETRESANAPYMYVFAKPTGLEEIESVQSAGKKSVEAFERNLRRGAEASDEAGTSLELEDEAFEREDEQMPEDGSSATLPASDATTWDEVRLIVENAVEDDEGGLGVLREAMQDALEESGLLEARSLGNTRLYVDVLLSVITDGRIPAKSEDSLASSAEEAASTLEEDRDDQAFDADDGSSCLTSDTIRETEAAFDNDQLVGSPGQTSDSREIDREAESTAVATPLPADVVDQEDVQNESQGIEATPSLETSPDAKNDMASDSEQSGIDTKPSSSIATLRTLILQMARQIDERMLSESGDEGDEASKLEEFEQILRNLVDQYKGGQTMEFNASEGQSNAASEAQEESSAGDEEWSPDSDDLAPEGESSPETDGARADDDPATISLADVDKSDDGVIGFVVTARNLVGGKYVARPEKLRPGGPSWEVEYDIEQMEESRAKLLYQRCKQRRKKTMSTSKEDARKAWLGMFDGELKKRSAKGRAWLKGQEALDRERPVHVVGEAGSRTFEEVFGKP